MREKNNGEGDIEIKFIGLRKGEKMHEELVIGNELQPTNNPQISKSIEEHYTFSDIEMILNKIEKQLYNGSEQEMLVLLKKYINNFQHQVN